MNAETAHTLADATNAFYRENAASFSLTRQLPWPGWQRVMENVGMDGRANLSVLDVACGNLRFETYLERTFPGTAFEFHAVDDCDALLPDEPQVVFARCDIIRLLLDEPGSVPVLRNSTFDLAVCFGFMHHVPTYQARAQLVRSLADAVRPGGHVALSFWQFIRNEKLASKAKASTPLGLEQLGLDANDLDQNDYLLGWQQTQGSWRYCHHFDEHEIDRLASASGLRTIDRFHADGRTGNLNGYRVLQKPGQ